MSESIKGFGEAKSNVDSRPMAKATSDVKSGHVNTEFPGKVLGGYPGDKSVDEIERVNRPKKAPGSVRA